MKTIIGISMTVLVMGLFACRPASQTESEKQDHIASENQSTTNMNTYVSIFEIPATDITRAIAFYQSILGIKIEQMEIPGMEMGILPYEDQAVVGLITKGEGYQPSAEGTTIYLNAGDNLQVILDKVESNGGKIIMPKTPHADESGYFALFLDSEGNKLGLHSPN